jgi:mannose/fructose/N-acetylgalactosamine-specific phosphotransferase system component IIC
MFKTLLISSVVGGVLTTDVLVAFQFMVNRPLVAATVTAWALGEPGAGLALGCLMELIWAGALPVGSVVPPDFTLAAVFASAASVIMHQGGAGLNWEACLVWSLLWSIPYAWVAGLADQWQRRWHRGLAEAAEKALAGGDESALGRAIASSVGVAFSRGFLLTALALALLVHPMGFILERIFKPAHEAMDWMYWLGLMLGFVVITDLFWERRFLRAGAVSFVATALALYVFNLRGSTVLAAAAAAALLAATIFERRARA